jgi:hypothetical protein
MELGLFFFPKSHHSQMRVFNVIKGTKQGVHPLSSLALPNQQRKWKP